MDLSRNYDYHSLVANSKPITPQVPKFLIRNEDFLEWTQFFNSLIP
jgi:hypothetical protein